MYIFLVQNNICLTVSEYDMLSKYTPAGWVGLVWKLAFGHGEYIDLMLVMFQQSNSFLVHQVGVEKKQVLQHMDSAASLASSASEQAQVESIRWKRKNVMH